MIRMSLIMLKPHTNIEIENELLNELKENDLQIYYKKEIYVDKKKLIKSQPSLTNGKYTKDECEKILKFSIGNSKFFIVIGDENVFEKLKSIKWKIRNKYREQLENKFCKPYVHSSENEEELERDVLNFLPEKLIFVKNINHRVNSESMFKLIR